MEKIDWTVVLSRAAGELSVLQLAMLKNAAIPHWNAERLRELALKKQP